jgi:HD-GYP domain-containing protein (c-di-GMP phosphodiesterase class II)
MDVTGTVINCALLLLTAAVVLFAWQTVRESRKATKAAQDTVAAMEKLLTASEASTQAARETVEESKETTRAAQDTVAAVEKLLAVARDTATASEASARAARETVEITDAAQEADRRYRQLGQLREIGRSVQRILLDALQAMDATYVSAESMLAKARWRSAEQNALGVLLVGVEPPLPKCKALVGANQVSEVAAAAREADTELAAVFHSLGANY